MTGPRFWSNGFDMDLPAVLGPRLDEVLGTTANLPLWVHGGTSHGRLNHPSVWGGVAYFGTSTESMSVPDWYHTDQPVTECTWREALRDAWPHHYLLLVDGQPMWDTRRLSGVFTKLMYHERGWKTLECREADRLRGEVLASVIAATRALERHCSERVS
jgi:hypothetical protein